MIELRDVTKTHHLGETEVRALRGVTCDVERGSWTYVLGPSGSGKSTLLYLLGALDDPTSGEIRVDGRRLDRLGHAARDAYRRDEVGFVFQSFNLLRNLTALDNVLVPFMPRGLSPDMHRRAVELLERVNLGHRLGHHPSQLSGGEQQRVAIARALLKNPKLVLADEPTGELDSVTGAEVLECLREVHRDTGATVIVVTHDRDHVRPGDRVLRLRDGAIVGDEIASEVDPGVAPKQKS